MEFLVTWSVCVFERARASCTYQIYDEGNSRLLDHLLGCNLGPRGDAD